MAQILDFVKGTYTKTFGDGTGVLLSKNEHSVDLKVPEKLGGKEVISATFILTDILRTKDALGRFPDKPSEERETIQLGPKAPVETHTIRRETENTNNDLKIVVTNVKTLAPGATKDPETGIIEANEDGQTVSDEEVGGTMTALINVAALGFIVVGALGVLAQPEGQEAASKALRRATDRLG